MAPCSISVAFGAKRTLSPTDIAKLERHLAETITQWAEELKHPALSAMRRSPSPKLRAVGRFDVGLT